MTVFRLLFRSLLVEITCAEPEKALQEIIQAGLFIRRIHKKSDLIYQFSISFKDFHSISNIIQTNGGKIAILSRSGLYWPLKKLVSRPVIIFMITTLLVFTHVLPTVVLFVETEGNQDIADSKLLTAAENCGISFGASRKDIRSEKTKNLLLSAIPELQWAGINTFGCRAVISVKERSKVDPISEDSTISNLVANQDAYVLSAIVTKGTSLVHPGDSVTKGQTLVSGYVDHGFQILATRSSGEVLGLTTRTLSAVTPKNRSIITQHSAPKYRISLLLRKKRINLWKDSSISDACCGRMYKEYFISLPGGYRLPVAVCVDRYLIYETKSHTVSEVDAYADLQHFSDVYLSRQMIAGQILQKQHQDFSAEGIYLLKSNYTCSEIISREQREQIGDHNGKRN